MNGFGARPAFDARLTKVQATGKRRSLSHAAEAQFEAGYVPERNRAVLGGKLALKLAALLLNPGSYEVRIVPVNGQGEVTKSVTLMANQTVLVR